MTSALRTGAGQPDRRPAEARGPSSIARRGSYAAGAQMRRERSGARSPAARGRRDGDDRGRCCASSRVGGFGWLWTSGRRSPLSSGRRSRQSRPPPVTVRITDARTPPARGRSTSAMPSDSGPEIAWKWPSAAVRRFSIGGASVRVARRHGGRLSLDWPHRAGAGRLSTSMPIRRGVSVSVAVETPFRNCQPRRHTIRTAIRPESLDVRVREGEVSVELPSRPADLESRRSVARRARDRRAERRQISTSGPEWAWVTTMAQPFILEGATVSAFLAG